MSKKPDYEKTTKIANRLMIAGAILLTIAGFISLTFIRPTNFKQQYKDKQYQQCIEQNNSEETCHQNYQ